MDSFVFDCLNVVQTNKEYVDIINNFAKYNFCLHNPLQNYLYQTIILEQAKCNEAQKIEEIYKIKQEHFKIVCFLLLRLGASAEVLHNLFVNNRNLSLQKVDNNTSVFGLVLSNLSQETIVLDNLCKIANLHKNEAVESVFEILIEQQQYIIDLLQNMCENDVDGKEKQETNVHLQPLNNKQENINANEIEQCKEIYESNFEE